MLFVLVCLSRPAGGVSPRHAAEHSAGLQRPLTGTQLQFNIHTTSENKPFLGVFSADCDLSTA